MTGMSTRPMGLPGYMLKPTLRGGSASGQERLRCRPTVRMPPHGMVLLVAWTKPTGGPTPLSPRLIYMRFANGNR